MMPAKISNDTRVDLLRGKYPDHNIKYSHSEGYKYYFSFNCPVCAEDEYSINKVSDSTFITEYTILLKKPLCRCNSNKKTKEMKIYDVKRKLNSLGFTVTRLSEWESWKTKVFSICNLHKQKELSPNTLNELMHSGHKPFCRLCSREKSLTLLQDKVDKVLEGTSYKGLAIGDDEVYVNCNVCAKDLYCTLGLCPNSFKTTYSSLRRGNKVSCRCSRTPYYSLDMRKAQIEEIMISEGNGYKFIEWVTEDLGVDHTRFTYICPLHGEKESSVSNYVNSKRRCIDCRNDNQEVGLYKRRLKEIDHLYLLTTKDSSTEFFTKVGRSLNPLKRKGNYSENVIGYPTIFEVCFSGCHEDIYNLEQATHKFLHNHHYTPENKFDGSVRECFSVTPETAHQTICHLLESGEYPSVSLIPSEFSNTDM